jgi:hypothetical protein
LSRVAQLARRLGWDDEKAEQGSPSIIAALSAAAIFSPRRVVMAIYQEQLYSEQQVKKQCANRRKSWHERRLRYPTSRT